jgi:membrane protein
MEVQGRISIGGKLSRLQSSHRAGTPDAAAVLLQEGQIMAGIATSAWHYVRKAASDWVDDKAPQMGAALAFYSVLSLAPLLLISLAVAGLYNAGAARSSFLAQIESTIGTEGKKMIEGVIEHAQQPKTGTAAAIIGVAMLLLGASGVFGQIQSAMNAIWDVPPKASGGMWGFFRSRFLSFAMVLGTGFLLIVSLVLSAAIAAMGTAIGNWWAGYEAIAHVANAAATFIVMTILFAMMYKLLPDAPVAWRDAWIGGFITAVLFTIGKLAIGLYLGKSAVGSAYGAAGAFVVLLVWIYYTAQVLFFGAELTHAIAARGGETARA